MGVREQPDYFQATFWSATRARFTHSEYYTRVVLSFNGGDGQKPSVLRDYQKLFPQESIGLLDMVNNLFLERFRQRPHWFQETQFVNYDDGLQTQAEVGSFRLGVKLTSGWVLVQTH